MRLTPDIDDAPSADLIGQVRGVLNHRLRPRSPRPVVIALSGGGDSVALLLAVADWARDGGRQLLVLSVDHRLQPDSAAWMARCASLADSLGIPFRGLSWDGPKPVTGVSAAARAARHALLANAARESGARVILLGHTADDVLESRAMRSQGSSTPDPREWGPSPVWPEGRGLFLLRPLIDVRRYDIRRWLDGRDARWIEDPANRSATSARAIARRAIAAGRATLAPSVPSPNISELARACGSDVGGAITLPRAVLTAADADVAQAFTAIACVSAAGTRRPPTGARVASLTARIRSGDTFVASLAGARISADPALIRFEREPGEARRGGLAPMQAAAGVVSVWDGRFEIATDAPCNIVALDGLSKDLTRIERSRLNALGPATRRALPVVIVAEGAVSSPVLAPMAGVEVRVLALDRLQAACGLVTVEPL